MITCEGSIVNGIHCSDQEEYIILQNIFCISNMGSLQILYLDRLPLQQSVAADSHRPAIFLAAWSAEKDAVMWPCPSLPPAIWRHCQIQTVSSD